MKKLLSKFVTLVLVLMPLATALPAQASSWSVAGSYVINVNYLGTDYPENLVLAGTNTALTGSIELVGGGSPWTIDSGSVTGDGISLHAFYNSSPSMTLNMNGTIASDGSMGGDWADVNPGSRVGTWATTSGNATVPVQDQSSCSDMNIVSDTTNSVTGPDSTGPAVATWAHPVWASADSLGSGATWIWDAPLVTAPEVDQTSVFTKTFNVSGTVSSASIDLSADNGYVLKVNNVQVDDKFAYEFNYNTTTHYDLSSYVVSGANTLEVTIKNFALAGSSEYTNPAGLLYKATVNSCEPIKHEETITPAPTSSTVHIFKFINDAQATVESAGGVSFPMFTSTYNAPFTLGSAGWTTGDIAYEASTSPMAIGSSYSAEENTTTALVGTSCDNVHPYALVGYSVGNTLAEAQGANPTLTIPSFTNLQGDKYILVRNQTCTVIPPTFLKVHILKYLDGAKAGATSASGYQFPMTATWKTVNLNGGVSSSGNYALGYSHGGAADLYGADTSPMQAPADYTTNEVTDASSQVVSSANKCVPGKYLLNGYRTSALSFADAATQTLTAAAPVFTGLTADQYVIVDNSKCPTTGTLTVTKTAVNGNGTFNFTSDIPSNPSFSITTTAGTGSQTFTNVLAGIYHVTEGSLGAGWQQNSNTCSSVTVTASATASCTITNTKSATRTLGFWQTHTAYASSVFGTISGGMQIGSGAHKGTVTNTQTSGASQLFGAYYANIAKTSTGGKRTAIDQARMQLLQQLVSTKLNCAAFGCPSIGTLVTSADSAYAGTNTTTILASASALDAYNNSGDSVAISNNSSATPATSQLWANLKFWDLP